MSFSLAVNRPSLILEAKVPPHTTFLREAKLLLDLAVPTVIIQLGFTLPPFWIASYVGRSFGYQYLAGFTLGSLTGNLSTLSLLQGLYSAADTLSPQAFGLGKFSEVGLLAIRGFLASLIVIIPINAVLFVGMDKILVLLGQDELASLYAWQWYQIYVVALPFYALYMVTWKFLSAQAVMWPLVLSTLLCCGLILPISVHFLTHSMGFIGTSVANLVYEFSLAMSLLAWIIFSHPHHAGTWPGLDRNTLRQVLACKPFCTYLTLGAGGMLASAEWIYWEVLTFIVGLLGAEELSVHTVPIQVVMTTFMLPLGVGIALSIRLGATLPRCVIRAKYLVLGCTIVCTIVMGVFVILLYGFRETIFGLFTNEAVVLEGLERIWWKVCVYLWNLSFFALNLGIATGLGMQWTLGAFCLLFLIVLGLPLTYYFAVVRGGGLDAVWTWINPAYLATNVALIVSFATRDWEWIATMIRQSD